jgi:hypothetical protein
LNRRWGARLSGRDILNGGELKVSFLRQTNTNKQAQQSPGFFLGAI